MNFKYYFHGKISVSPKDSPGDYFTIEPRIECIIMPPLFMLGKKIPDTPDDEVLHFMKHILKVMKVMIQIISSQLESMYPDYNIKIELNESYIEEIPIEDPIPIDPNIEFKPYFDHE